MTDTRLLERAPKWIHVWFGPDLFRDYGEWRLEICFGWHPELANEGELIPARWRVIFMFRLPTFRLRLASGAALIDHRLAQEESRG